MKIGNRENRVEEGYFINPNKLHILKNDLDKIFRIVEMKTPYNQTIYFNNKDHEVPFNFSIRARRYALKATGKKFFPPINEQWRFEIKKSEHGASRNREKVSLALPFKKICGLLKSKKLLPFRTIRHLYPYIAATYYREHYHLKRDDNFRITIDTNTKYYLFDKSGTGKLVREEEIVRIELKFPLNFFKSKIYNHVIQIIEKLGGSRPFSKKHSAYNLEYKYLKNKFRRWTIGPNTEIESKMLLSIEDQNIFNKIKEDFRSNKVKRFGLIKKYDYSWEYNTVARFILTKDRSHVRLNMEKREVVHKSPPVVVTNDLNLKCILKRTEIKKKAPKKMLLEPFKERRRSRKTFVVENRENKNIYIILVDRTSIEGRDLYQLEVENLSRSPSSGREKQIVGDIAFITNFILKKYKKLKPTILTKQEWVVR